MQQVAADKCYALAFSSGDESSAYQAGVLKGFVEAMSAEETAYSAISGVSGGAINTAILANYPTGQEGAAADRMVTFWQNASNTKLYKDWLGGIAEGLLLKGGLYNDAAALDFLKGELADITPSNRWIDIGLTDVLKGKYTDFHGDQLVGDDLYNIMYAQFAQAGFFPPVEYQNTDWFDGSTIWDLDIFSVVNKCQETHADEDIVVDVILTSEKTLKKVDASNYKSIQMFWRYLAVSRYYSSMDGLLRAQFAYPNITFRNVVAPSADLPSSIYPLNQDQAAIDQMVALGVKDGKAAVAGGADEVENTSHFFALKHSHDNRISGKDYDDFKAMKAAGLFGENYKFKGDKKYQALFLQ